MIIFGFVATNKFLRSEESCHRWNLNTLRHLRNVLYQTSKYSTCGLQCSRGMMNGKVQVLCCYNTDVYRWELLQWNFDSKRTGIRIWETRLPFQRDFDGWLSFTDTANLTYRRCKIRKCSLFDKIYIKLHKLFASDRERILYNRDLSLKIIYDNAIDKI